MKSLRTSIDGQAVRDAWLGPSPANREIPMVVPKARPAHRQAQDRKSMLDRAIGLIERARRSGAVLDIDAETENLLH